MGCVCVCVRMCVCVRVCVREGVGVQRIIGGALSHGVGCMSLKRYHMKRCVRIT